jgi:hypothetical protein
MTKDKRGGKRAGAGAKPMYNEPTKSVHFKVPESKVTEVKSMVNRFLAAFKIR